jgi:hypothetical protein
MRLPGPFFPPRGGFPAPGSVQPLGGGCVPLAAAAFFLLPLLIVLGNCAGAASGGLPTAPGRYPVKERSVTFDGERYSFLWADAAGNLQRATTRDVKLRLAEQNLLEITETRDAILHLKQDEPVQVEARDQRGDFGNFWYPFLIGQLIGGGGGPVVINQPAPREYQQPVYRYPPTDRFDRGDTLTGSQTTDRPGPPDYGRLAPIGGAVSGQAGGAGGGQAATNRAESAGAVSGQRGGAGSGSAALNKSGSFRTGDQGYASKVDSGELSPITGRREPRVGAGSGALGGGGAAATTKPRIETGRGTAPSPRVSSPPRSGGGTPRISTKPRR